MNEWFDFNDDGVVDAGEKYLAFRIWEDVCGIVENGEDTEEDEA